MKLSLKKAAVTAFFAFIGITGLLTLTVNSVSVAKDTYIAVRDTVSAGSGMNDIMKGVVRGADNGFSSNLFGQNSFIDIYGLVEKAAGRRYILDADSSYNIIKDDSGKLHFLSFREDNSAAVDEIAAMNETLKKNGIDFLYVQTPIKYIKGFTKIDPSLTDYSNENSDKIVARLRESGVNVFDLRNLLDDDRIDKGTLFYDTDHHWRIETAFWGAGRTAEKIKTLFGRDMDPEGFYTDFGNYRSETYEDSFLGSQGRRVGRYFAGTDDFTLVTPDFDTDYEVTVKKKDSVDTFEGDFSQAVIRRDILEDKDIFTNRYVSYFGADYPEVIINNKAAENDLKLLIVKDSFGIPFSAFMSLMASETRMLDMRYYKDGTAEEYALEYRPDIVLYVFRSIRTIE